MLKPSLILSLIICFVSLDAFAQADEETNNDNTSRQTDHDKKKEKEKKKKTINTAKRNKKKSFTDDDFEGYLDDDVKGVNADGINEHEAQQNTIGDETMTFEGVIKKYNISYTLKGKLSNTVVPAERAWDTMFSLHREGAVDIRPGASFYDVP